MTWRFTLAVVLLVNVSLSAQTQGETQVSPRVLQPQRHTRDVPLVDGYDLHFKRVAIDGLSQTRVAQIVQDEKGFMWFGTQHGLYRYDGHELRVFRHEARRRTSLSGVYVYSLLRDRANTLWVGNDDFLDRFQPATESVTQYSLTPDNDRAGPANVSCMNQDSSGALWLCTRNGLYRLDPASQRSLAVRHDPADPSSLSSNAVQFVGEDRRGALWVGTGKGFDLLHPDSHAVTQRLPLPVSLHGMSFHEDRFGGRWMIYGADGQLATLNPEGSVLSTWRPISKNADAGAVSFSTMLEDRDGTMWFGTLNHGILMFDRGRQRFVRYTARPSDPNSLSDRRVTVLYQDREGLIWAGLHQAEPNYFSPRPPVFRAVRVDGRQSALVSAILEDDEGQVWLGFDRGLGTLDRTTGDYRDVAAFRSDETTSMVQDADGALWIGTAGQGLKQYDPRTGAVKIYRHDPESTASLPSNYVEQVTRDRSGRVWAVTWRGLARWEPDGGAFLTYMPEAAPEGLTFHTATFGRNGVIWIGSNLGLHRFDPETQRFQWFRHDKRDPQSLSNDRVNSIHEAADGTLWIGTQNGLDHWDANASPLAHYADSDGLSGNTVSCILEDEARRLWISTNRGISRLDIATGQFKAYGTAEGLPGVNLTGWGGCSRAASGEMFFAGFAGAAAFFPHADTQQDYLPPAVLTSLRLFDAEFSEDGSPVKAISHTSAVTLLPRQNKFSIEFAALSFLSPGTNRFRYRMQGMQDEWIDARGDQRVATYMALPPGSYSFQVQAATAHGPWNAAAATLNIVMLPPWWRSWPFYFGMTLAAIAAMSVAYRVRVRQLSHNYNVRLEERSAERTRIARELHDTLLQSFQGLMFRLQAVRDLLPLQPEKAMPVLDTALQRGEDAIDQARNAVGGLRSAETVNPNLDSGLAALAATAAHLCREQTTPSWELVTRGRARDIPGPVLYEVYQVVQEALGNAFRHARARRIMVSVRYGVGTLSIGVSDDGVGFDGAAPPGSDRGHWGLQCMQERVEKLGGRLTLRTRPAEGTMVEVAVPAAVAYREASVFSYAGALLWSATSWRSRSRD